MTRLYWTLTGLAALVAIGIPLLTELPPASSVNLQVLEQFYHATYVVGAVIGVACGLGCGVHSVASVRHRPGETAGQFAARVAKRGLFVAAGSVLGAVIADVVLAAVATMEPLGPLDKVYTVTPALLSIAGPAIAGLAALLTFAVATRWMRWGGTYALINAG